MKAVKISQTELSKLKLPEAMTYFRNFFGKAAHQLEGPQAYLVNMPDEGGIVRPHFHDVDQFQVVVEGDGRFGKKVWRPVTFHYADAYTPYGPILSNNGGISFFTLRVASASGQYEMPGSRHLMPGRAGRMTTGTFDLRDNLPPEGICERTSLLASHPDGLKASGFCFGPHARQLGDPCDGGGQYYIVCQGDLIVGDEKLPPTTLIFVDPHEEPPLFVSGSEGAQLVMLQFPRPSERPGSDPVKLNERDRSKDYVLSGD